ncbi:glycosyltransferase family protein [Brevibacillus sp. H7]|uniref:glycosyltransferase family protein n=1 Tax=Brevibacillus sp. H7 TaxID=3349138 RepID=UPI00381B676C
MDLSYIERKLQEIYRLRSQIFKDMNLEHHNHTNTLNGLPFITKKFKRTFSLLKDMKIACIMDEFTYHSFEPECQLFQITPTNWRQELESFKTDLFFLESAWRGIDSLWNTKVAHLSDELIEVLNYCRKNSIPVVFWNKEDPVHFETFIATAKYADFVFTTDIDCIKKYKTLLKHNRVYLMPFAAQTKYHNPVEIYKREDKYCFAGAYYKRYPDRARDLETFVDTITSMKDLDIYDRNYFNQDPNYTFPSAYKKYIIGNLKPEEIEKAYKGYRFNINMNSVKQSQTMCARRIFELLASNTVTVSNYSRAIRNFLGDLVVCTDDGKRLRDEIQKFDDPEYYSKFRLLGLRKVLAEHTYRDRLTFLVEKVYVNPLEEKSIKVAVIAQADTKEEVERAIRQFKRQTYRDKKLFIITDIAGDDVESDEVQLINSLTDDIIDIMQSQYEYWVFFSAHDYYGKNYVLDLVLALKFTELPVITKDAYFAHRDGSINRVNGGHSYQPVDTAQVRKAFIQANHFTHEALKEYAQYINEGTISAPCMSIDEYNYCMNYTGDECDAVDDLVLADTGINMDTFYEIVDQIQPSSMNSKTTTLTAADIFKHIGKSKQVSMSKDNDDVYVDSRLDGCHEYLYINKVYHLDELNAYSKLNVYLDVEFLARFSVDIVAIILDKNQNKIGHIVKPCNRNVTIDIDKHTKYIKFGLRLSGRGICRIKELVIGDIQMDTGCFLNKSKVLLITDNYPDYQDLYRYAFIHSRLTEYKNKGQVVDVFKCSERYPKCYSEFGGIDVACGYYEEVNNALLYGSYDTVLIHFLSETIWNGIRHSIKGKKIIVWVHGAEIQPWWRREYNYSTQQQLENAKKDSEKRLSFWREIFNLALNKSDYKFHFVFVSDYFAKEVFEDTQITLPEEKYSIIHNYINSNLFNYIEKEKDLRKKILSIRPFANHKYANDLTVKAILELSKDPIFSELEFRIIGKGELFESTVKPIRKFKNVFLEEKFLRQEEIAALHKEYGVFLVPTRMDSQGVSRDEAMSSGLVPITNNVAAIPEFVDQDCGMLVDEEDYLGLAESIKKLYHEPELFQQLSRNAAERVRRQSGINSTIVKEIELINM